MNFAIVLFSVILITGFTISSYADYVSPKKQIDSGIAINDIQCRDDRVLVLRTNGNVACVTEKSAERTGWKILKTEFIHTEKLVTIPEQVTPTIVMIDQSSDVEFVDDGRDIDYGSAGGLSSPRDLYQYVIGKQMKHSEFQNDGEGNITLAAVQHEKYSLKPNKTFYLEDWLPDYVPDGYKLLYSQTDWSEKNQRSSVTHQYVPTTFVLTEDYNSRDSIKSQGFSIGVSKYTYELGSIEDRIERNIEKKAMFGGHYGEGYNIMYRDSKPVQTYSGGTTHHWYQASLSMHPDKNTSFIISTNYLTLDEILPIFNSVGN